MYHVPKKPRSHDDTFTDAGGAVFSISPILNRLETYDKTSTDAIGSAFASSCAGAMIHFGQQSTATAPPKSFIKVGKKITLTNEEERARKKERQRLRRHTLKATGSVTAPPIPTP